MPNDDGATAGTVVRLPDPGYYRAQASRFRRMARTAPAPRSRDYLLDMASHFEQLAVAAEA